MSSEPVAEDTVLTALVSDENYGSGDEDEDVEVFFSVDSALESVAAEPFQIRLLSALFLANACDAVEVLSIGFILPAYVDHEGNTLSKTQENFLTAAVFAGMLVGGLMSGSSSDRCGRRPTLVAALTMNFASAALSAVSPTTNTLIGCRVIAGLAIGASVPALFSCAAELFPPTKRGAYITIISSAWMVGSMATAGLAWAVLGNVHTSDDDDGEDDARGTHAEENAWRLFAGLCALFPGSAALAAYAVVPESPRYLISIRKEAEATVVLEKQILTRYLKSAREPSSSSGNGARSPDSSALWKGARKSVRRVSVRLGGDDRAAASADDGPTGPMLAPSPDVREDFSEAPQPRVTSTSSSSSSSSSTSSSPSSSSVAWLVRGAHAARTVAARVAQDWRALLFSDPKTRAAFVSLVVVWVSLSFGYYGLATWITVLFDSVGLSDPYVASFLYCAANFPGNLLVFLCVDRCGRRPLLLVSMLAATASALLFAFASGGGGPNSALLVVTASMLFNAWCTSAWDVINVITTEAFPTQLRATALGVLSACGRLGSVAAQFVNGSLQSNVALLLAVTAGTMLVGAGAAAALPRNQPASGVTLE